MPLQRLIETAEQHFAWKVRQRKRQDRNPLLVTFQDKYEAKLYALERGVKSAELLWVTDEAAKLPLELRPRTRASPKKSRLYPGAFLSLFT